MTSVATEEQERQLWDELTSLLVDVVPSAVETDDLDAILFAVTGRDPKLHALYQRVRKMARTKPGYLRDRLEEDNPIAKVRRRVYGREWV